LIVLEFACPIDCLFSKAYHERFENDFFDSLLEKPKLLQSVETLFPGFAPQSR